MGDADRTPEDVIAHWASGSKRPDEYDWAGAVDLLNVLAAAGYAVVPQRDVDAAARLRALDNAVCRVVNALERSGDFGPAAANLRRALVASRTAAAVGSVDPEGETDA